MPEIMGSDHCPVMVVLSQDLLKVSDQPTGSTSLPLSGARLPEASLRQSRLLVWMNKGPEATPSERSVDTESPDDVVVIKEEKVKTTLKRGGQQTLMAFLPPKQAKLETSGQVKQESESLTPGSISVTQKALTPGSISVTQKALTPGSISVTQKALTPGSVSVTQKALTPGSVSVTQDVSITQQHTAAPASALESLLPMKAVSESYQIHTSAAGSQAPIEDWTTRLRTGSKLSGETLEAMEKAVAYLSKKEQQGYFDMAPTAPLCYGHK
eukprot:Blabericola_migrator_1__10894@NODE_628_length_7173_cov_74_949901_g459_i0_p3_GENE_NODE_628_length_7173_cov_74_949901_g459_i0NODE_628_length_7173_cov_74_949901_g459_i0_p3_ORF_typecomplete_len269_score61_55PROCT/PF08084_11/30PROCT/PF08084_11/7_3_NODE_628_length_7173_cov_74_949901_g459_i032664072